MSKVKVDVYSHCVRVHGLSKSDIAQLQTYIGSLTQVEVVESYDYRTDRTTQVPVVRKKYFVKTDDDKELFVHRHLLEGLLEALRSAGISKFEIREKEAYKPEPADIRLVDTKVPRDYQVPIIDALKDAMKTRGVTLRPGLGKAHAHGSWIRVPNGWKRIEDIKVNDIVIARDGTPVRVTAVHPQGKKECVRLTTIDGRHSEIDLSHLWTVYNEEGEKATLTTKELRYRLKNEAFFLPLPHPDMDGLLEQFEPINLDQYWSEEDETYNLPTRLLTADYGVRLALLRELMKLVDVTSDTFTMCVTNGVFKEQIKELLYSVGGIVHEHQEPGQYILTTQLENAKALLKDDLGDIRFIPTDKYRLRIKSIKDIGERYTTCISIEHEEQLYVIDQYLVTHNTFCALKAAEAIKQRVILMLLPKYFGVWEEAIQNDLVGEYTTESVQGFKQLTDIINRAANGGKIADIVFMSVTTYRAYIEALEKFGSEGMKEIGYVIPPYEFHSRCGIGVQINDEVQDDPGLYFRVDTVTNVKKEIFLTATPYTGDDKLTEKIKVMMPDECDVPLPADDKYTNVVAIRYNDPGVRPSDYTGYMRAYSHIKYESTLLKNKERKLAYFSKVARIIHAFYISEYQKGQKMAIYAATKAFIMELLKYLKKRFPDYTLTEYVSETDFSAVLNNDIIITTIKSAGAGVDIVNLKEVLLLHMTNSQKDTVQVAGRPRRLKDYPDIDPRFSYLVCNQIPKHLGYRKNKTRYLLPYAKTHVDREIR